MIWSCFHRTDLPVLVHAAVAHAQFETIHPFADGNGRAGRALVHVLLKRAGTTRRITVPVSAGLLGDTDAILPPLTAYRDGEVDPIVSIFAAATFSAVANGRRLNGGSPTSSRSGTQPDRAKRLGSLAGAPLPVAAAGGDHQGDRGGNGSVQPSRQPRRRPLEARRHPGPGQTRSTQPVWLARTSSRRSTRSPPAPAAVPGPLPDPCCHVPKQPVAQFALTGIDCAWVGSSDEKIAIGTFCLICSL